MSKQHHDNQAIEFLAVTRYKKNGQEARIEIQSGFNLVDLTDELVREPGTEILAVIPLDLRNAGEYMLGLFLAMAPADGTEDIFAVALKALVLQAYLTPTPPEAHVQVADEWGDLIRFLVVTEWNERVEIESTSELSVTQDTTRDSGGQVLAVIALNPKDQGHRLLASHMAQGETSRRGQKSTQLAAKIKSLILRAYRLGHPRPPAPESDSFD